MCPVTGETEIDGIQLSLSVVSAPTVTAGPEEMLRGVDQVVPPSVDDAKKISERGDPALPGWAWNATYRLLRVLLPGGVSSTARYGKERVRRLIPPEPMSPTVEVKVATVTRFPNVPPPFVDLTKFIVALAAVEIEVSVDHAT
jgi:hypothetical protein